MSTISAMPRAPRIRASSALHARAHVGPDRLLETAARSLRLRKITVRWAAVAVLIGGLAMMAPSVYREQPDAGVSDLIKFDLGLPEGEGDRSVDEVGLLLYPGPASSDSYRVALVLRGLHQPGEVRVSVEGPASEQVLSCDRLSRYSERDLDSGMEHISLSADGRSLPFELENVEGRRQVSIPISHEFLGEPRDHPPRSYSKTVSITCDVRARYVQSSDLSGSLARVPAIWVSSLSGTTFSPLKYGFATDIDGYVAPDGVREDVSFDMARADLYNAQTTFYGSGVLDYHVVEPIQIEYRSDSGAALAGQLSIFGTLLIGAATGLLTADAFEIRGNPRRRGIERRWRST